LVSQPGQPGLSVGFIGFLFTFHLGQAQLKPNTILAGLGGFQHDNGLAFYTAM